MIRIKFFLAFVVLCNIKFFSQQNDYWKNAPLNGTKVYTILFNSENNGEAISAEGEKFISIDSGKTWQINSTQPDVIKNPDSNYYWSGEIFCSVMKTTDNGMSWTPYLKEKQDHFCYVYLKDPNVGYQKASEFLNSVTTRIFFNIKNKNIDLITDHPQQCTEYYTNENEGWAVGWCLKNFSIKKGN